MDRRRFLLTSLAGALAAPLAAEAQPAAKVLRASAFFPRAPFPTREPSATSRSFSKGCASWVMWKGGTSASKPDGRRASTAGSQVSRSSWCVST